MGIIVYRLPHIMRNKPIIGNATFKIPRLWPLEETLLSSSWNSKLKLLLANLGELKTRNKYPPHGMAPSV